MRLCDIWYDFFKEIAVKIGFNMLLWTSHITEEDFSILDKLKKVGYDGIEVPVFEGDTSHFEKIGKVLKDKYCGN